jgi:topoisomerase-4 subunit A
MVIFPLNQVPEMNRGAGVRLQRYRDGVLTDIMTFDAKGDGMNWFDSAGRAQNTPLKELAAWRGNRGDAGRVKPDRFPKNNRFGRSIG